MKLPRNLSGTKLIQGLEKIGYVTTRQRGSHVRPTATRNGEHHVTVPLHNPLKIGTLAAILNDVASHLRIERSVLFEDMS